VTWTLRYSLKADKQLSKMDKNNARILVAWLNKNIDGCQNPRLWGNALVGSHAGKWRYRVGIYRILVDIQDTELVVLALEVGHRLEVYKR
jgi:mRNA interferase RelE/StbE